MNETQAIKILRTVSTKTKGVLKLDPAKVLQMPVEDARRMVFHIVRNRLPIVKEFVDRGETDLSWLRACGYLYTTKGPTSGLTFLHTCEHRIK